MIHYTFKCMECKKLWLEKFEDLKGMRPRVSDKESMDKLLGSKDVSISCPRCNKDQTLKESYYPENSNKSLYEKFRVDIEA